MVEEPLQQAPLERPRLVVERAPGIAEAPEVGPPQRPVDAVVQQAVAAELGQDQGYQVAKEVSQRPTLPPVAFSHQAPRPTRLLNKN